MVERELVCVGSETDCDVCDGKWSLVSYKSRKVSPNAIEWIEECKKCGLKRKCYLNFKTKHRKEQIIHYSRFPKKKQISEISNEPVDLFDEFLEGLR